MKTIAQKERFKGERRFAIEDGNKIRVSYTIEATTEEYVINAAELSDDPIRRKHSAYGSIIATAGFSLIALIMALVAVFAQTTEQAGVGIFYGGLCTIVAIICARKMVKSRYDITIFQNRLGGANITLFNDNPNPITYKDFEAALIATIQEAKTQHNQMGQKTIAQELKEISALRDQGVLTEDEFSRLKEGLIQNASAQKRIGFEQ